MNDDDIRLVELYEDDNPDGPDHDFYRTLANEIVAESVLDLGCGTDILTAQLHETGFEVQAVYGDWQRTEFTPDAAQMVFVVRAR